ncbi:MAG TPA: preprotein translocase subunit SecA, partial [Mycobacterium sp.]|nr:preprotein translocase subunit SecA [Mycobacterium sp.]
EHLYEMDYLKEGIGLRAMAQRDPLVEYQREGFDMFTGMLDALKEESIGFLFNVQVEPAPQTTVAPVAAPAGLAALGRDDAEPTVRAKGINDQDDSRPLTYVGPAEDGGVEVKHADGAGRPKAAGGSRRERREAKRQQSKGGRGILRRG